MLNILQNLKEKPVNNCHAAKSKKRNEKAPDVPPFPVISNAPICRQESQTSVYFTPTSTYELSRCIKASKVHEKGK